jgi:arylsulfatase A-like enzyme
VEHPPNILVLVLDTLRARSMSCYGYSSATTPQLDRFARENLLFTSAMSAATWTVPSHASLLTGLYVSQHRIETTKGDRRFNRQIVTLPAALGRGGYRTAAFSHNPLFTPSYGLGEGFDEFVESEDLVGSRTSSSGLGRVRKRVPKRIAEYSERLAAPGRVLGTVERWIADSNGATPFFAFANVLAPHFPWAVPPRFLLRSGVRDPRLLTRRDYVTLKDNWKFNAGLEPVTDGHRRAWTSLYDAAVRHVDAEVGAFLKRLRQLPQWEQTIVVITSDHGELLGDPRGIVGHLLCLHDDLVHVPLLVRHPVERDPVEVEGVVQTLDLYSTLLEWSGVATDGIPAAQLARRPLTEAVSRSRERGGVAYAEEDYSDSYDLVAKLRELNPALDTERFPRVQRMARSANAKLVCRDGEPGEVYDLEEDPRERRNLVGTGAARAHIDDLGSAVASWQDALEHFPPEIAEAEIANDAETEDRLRALGYIP